MKFQVDVTYEYRGGRTAVSSMDISSDTEEGALKEAAEKFGRAHKGCIAKRYYAYPIGGLFPHGILD